MRSTDILDQIDAALHDDSISPDAMRYAPNAEAPPGQPAAGTSGRSVLVRRLTERHGIDPDDAREAVLAAELGRATEHAAIVRAEARAVMDEALQRLRIAFRPMAESMTETLKQLSQAFEQLRASASTIPTAACGRRSDRPAWQSPYGPATRRQR